MTPVAEIQKGDLIRIRHYMWPESITGRTFHDRTSGHLSIGGCVLSGWEPYLAEYEVLERAEEAA